VSNEDIEEKTESTFWGSIANFFKGIGLKIKLIFGALIGIFGFISIFLLSKKINARQILELELKKIRGEIEVEKAQEEIDRNDEKLLGLEGRIKEIKEEIKELEEIESRDNVSNEELDEFFDDRGF
jgi:tetrahydromethanopterin S-methyltransferase subunit G